MATQATTITDRRPAPALLVGGAFVLTTLLSIAVHAAEVVFTDKDPHAPEGAIASITSIAAVGVTGLVVALAIAVPLSRDAARARTGAIVLGAIAVLALPLFWSGAPAALGACAAWLGGLARGSHPQTGAARGFGIVGIVIVVLEIVAAVLGGALGALIG